MNPQLTKATRLYKESQQPESLSQSLRRGKLEQALAIYRNEEWNANVEHQASLLRNIGVASLRLAEVLDAKFDLQLIIYHLAEAVTNLTNAWTLRRGNKQKGNTQWREKVEEFVSDCFERAFRSIDGDIESQRIPNFPLLEKILKAIGTDAFLNPFRMRFHLARGQYFYRCGIKALEVDNFKVTSRLLEYCREEGVNGLKFAEKKVIWIGEFERLQEDIDFLTCSCDSIRFRSQGDELFQKYMCDVEEVDFEDDFDMMWNVLDMYKAASLACREKDLENEAIADCRQGRLFEKVFKIKTKAKEYYRKGFDMAGCLHPKDFTNAGWFKECKVALERFQKKTFEEEERRKAEERAPYLQKLKAELSALKDVENDSYKLLKHIYTTHPPKHGTTTYKEEDVNGSNIKKTLMKGITQYHPDKQVNFEREWIVLCEEITKSLTARYECMKGF